MYMPRHAMNYYPPMQQYGYYGARPPRGGYFPQPRGPRGNKTWVNPNAVKVGNSM